MIYRIRSDPKGNYLAGLLRGKERVINEFIIRSWNGSAVESRLEKPGKRNYKRLYLSHPNLRDFVQ